MNSIRFFWEHSPFWLLPLAAAAIFCAWWQYRKQIDFGLGIRFFLGGIRALVYFLCGLLLLNPLLRYFRENILPPATVILVDNSRSVQLATRPDSLLAFRKNLMLLKEKLEKTGSQVFLEDLNTAAGNPDSIRFRNESSNLEAAVRRIRESFEGQNLNQIILASDGIINQGSDLQDLSPAFRMHCIGLGNPRQSKDLKIKEIRFNKTAYLGNQFPISVEAAGSGLRSGLVAVSLSENGRLLEKRQISLSPVGLANTVFMVKADKKGMHEYRIELDAQEGEITLENNKRVVFVEVATSRQKVLLLASCPHPDLKAIRSALESLDQIELQTCVGGLDAFRSEPFNLVILHQLPDKSGTFNQQVSRILEGSGTAVWLISTAFTDFSRLRTAAAAWLNVQGGGGQVEESGNQFDENFQGFQYGEEDRKVLSALPPVKTPGASYSWKGASETIIRQMIGRVATPTAMFSVQNGANARRAIFWGDGLWLWRLNNYARNENTVAVDQLIQKTVLLLLSQSRKKPLLVNGNSDEYAESEIPSFRIETFNELMEPVYDQKVRFSISGTSGKSGDYQFVTSRGNPVFKTQSLPPGAYHYTASCRIDGKEVSEEGNFIIRAFDLETRDLTANHALLQGLSRKGKGLFTGISGMLQLASASEVPAPLIEFTEWNENLLGLKTLLAILLGLLCLEWFLRKYSGSL